MSLHDHDNERKLTILYATETGNAQDVAERIALQCRHLRFSVHVYSMDEYQVVSQRVFSLLFQCTEHYHRTTYSQHISYCS